MSNQVIVYIHVQFCQNFCSEIQMTNQQFIYIQHTRIQNFVVKTFENVIKCIVYNKLSRPFIIEVFKLKAYIDMHYQTGIQND